MSYLYKPSIWSTLLTPLSWLLSLLIALRRTFYRIGILKTQQSEIPVIVVGNITVGGTGKSPVVDYLVKQLSAKGYKPGIVSRGYGGHAKNYPLIVNHETSALESGDEAKMLANKCRVPVVVDPNRANAINFLAFNTNCDIAISDDGLQHYAMGRDLELVVIDKSRGLGNQLLLPLGPLREPASRLSSVDAVLHNYRFDEPESLTQNTIPQFQLTYSTDAFVSLADPSMRLSINEMIEKVQKTAQAAYAVAGIGNPESFFDFLRTNNLSIDAQPFVDHHAFTKEDFRSAKEIILMTEKDAIKCQELGLNNAWYLEIAVKTNPDLASFCLEQLALKET